MIILSLLIATLPEIDLAKPPMDRGFYVEGWYCTAPGCEALPRKLGAKLRLASVAREAGFNKAIHLAKDWTITLDCAVSGLRLKRCKIQDDSTDLPVAKTLAVKIAQFAVLITTQSVEPRAIVQVSYNVSGCAPWMGCVIEGPPPPPPK